MTSDIIETLNDFIPEENSRKWEKLSSRINFRRLEMALLKEILAELRKLNEKMDNYQRT